MDIKVNVAYDRTLAALSHVKEAADVLAQVIINQGVHSPKFQEKLNRNSEYGKVMGMDNELTKEMAKPVEWVPGLDKLSEALGMRAEGRSIHDTERDVRAEIKAICDDVRAAVPEVASIHDMADKLRKQNAGLIEELKKALFSVDKWRGVAKGFEDDKNEWKKQAEHWEDTANRYCKDADYYMGIVDRIASELGPDAFMNDDGVRGDSPIRAKLVEMVSKLCREHGEARYELRRIGSRLLPFGCSLTDDGAIDIKSIDPTLAKALDSGYWPFGRQCPKPTEPWAIPAQPASVAIGAGLCVGTDPKTGNKAFQKSVISAGLCVDIDLDNPDEEQIRKLVDFNASYKLVNSNLSKQLDEMRNQRDTANRELAETNEALKIVVKERDDAREAVKYAQKLATRETDTRAEYARKLETNSKNLNKIDAELTALTIANDKLKQDYGELTAAYHGVNRAYNDLQRRASNARNALDLRLD